MNFDKPAPRRKKTKKITKERLKNIGLYYLERFETSVQNLRDVLKRRINKYAFENPDFDKNEAYAWVEEILGSFENCGYVNDKRYAQMKVKDYLSAGKSVRYIKAKLFSKGIDENTIETIVESQDYDAMSATLRFAAKKHIGPYRTNTNERDLFKKKDMACLLRAGFDYDDVCEVLNMKGEQ